MQFPPFQSKQEVVIHAPLQAVWEFGQDLTKIADYHPRVKRVDLISGKRQRGQGVAYMCYLKDGKNTCVEKDIEVVPMERIVTALPEDTMGITNMLPDYLVETRFTPLDEHETKVEFRHYYSTKSVKTRFLVGLPYLVEGHKTPFRRRSTGRGRLGEGKEARCPDP